LQDSLALIVVHRKYALGQPDCIFRDGDGTAGIRLHLLFPYVSEMRNLYIHLSKCVEIHPLRRRPHVYGLALHRWLRLDGSGTGGISKMRNLGIVVLGAALAGCASSSSDIAPAYVSPVAYQSYTCQQLALEAQAISTRAATLSGAQDSQRTKDGVATAAAIVIFWPAAFFVGGDKQTAAELSQMKGQMVAVEQASIAKKCGIQFQGPRPPGT